MLEVKFAEVDHNALLELGVAFSRARVNTNGLAGQ